MKVFIHYKDNTNEKVHKSIKLTLPKSWKSGPSSRLLTQFVESYNASKAIVEDGDEALPLSEVNPLNENDLHIEMEKDGNEASPLQTNLNPLGSDAIVQTSIPDRANLYVRHGPSQTTVQLAPLGKIGGADTNGDERTGATVEDDIQKINLVQCTRFGCRNRFPRGGPYPACTYHVAPPVFHETAKFWSCCPNRKAYDWDDFQEIKGCRTGICTDVRPEKKTPDFLGGMDLREIAAEKAGVKLKSIDDFNQSQMAGGSDKAPVLVRLKEVLCAELKAVESELFDQVVDGIKAKHGANSSDEDLWGIVADELGSGLKEAFKKMAVDQLRIS